MPTYDYECRECGHRWELFQQMSASPKRKCPECGRLRARRLIGPGAGIIFKGSGFYQTDYRSDSYKQGAEKAKKAAELKKESSDKSSKGGSSEGGSTKPNSKTDS